MLLRKLLPLSLLSLSTLPAMAGEPPREQLQPKAEQSLLLDITRAGNKLVAVGERGHVLLGDGTWQQVATPTAAQLTKVYFYNDALGWAVGHDATILHTMDGGKTWQVQFSAPERERPLMDVLFTSETQGVAIGAYGLFFKTADGGKTWEEVFHEGLLPAEDASYLNELKTTDPEAYALEKASLLPHFNRIVRLDDGRLLLVGELGLVAVSNDAGQHFTRLELGYEGSMFNALEAAGRVYVMGLRGHVFEASGNLDDWQQVDLPVESSINAALATAEGELYLVGNAGAVLKRSQGGDVTLVTRRQGENLLGAAQDEAGQIWLVGSKGLVVLTAGQKN